MTLLRIRRRRLGPVLAGVCLTVQSAPGANWPQWRGPVFNGSTTETGLPTEFSKTNNVRWVAPMPGPAGATPIIWGDHVFVSSTDRPNRTLVVMAAPRGNFIGSLGARGAQAAGQLERRGVAEAFYPQAFTSDTAQDCYRCPAGQTLRPESQWSRPGAGEHPYRAAAAGGAACALRAQCCPQSGAKGRARTRRVAAPEVRAFAAKRQTEEAKAIYQPRGAGGGVPERLAQGQAGVAAVSPAGLGQGAVGSAVGVSGLQLGAVDPAALAAGFGGGGELNAVAARAAREARPAPRRPAALASDRFAPQPLSGLPLFVGQFLHTF